MISTSVSSYDQAALSRLWQTLSSDGLPPYKAIGQLSYLLVLKKRAMCEEGGAPSFPWSALQSVPEDHFMYFGHCCGIEVKSVGEVRFRVHLYYEAYGRDFAEIWVRDETSWKETLAHIRQEI